MARTQRWSAATLQAPRSTHLQMALPGMVDDDPLWRHISSEPRLISLACALGALDYGGPLSGEERTLCARSDCGEPAPPAIVDAVRQSIRQGADPLLALLNIAHGLYPHHPLSAAQLVSLVQELNAARHTFSGHDRTYQGGLEKFEPREMEELAVREPA